MKNVIILCAGSGKRLLPLTEKTPKCLIQVLNKPIIQWEIDVLDELGVDNIHIVSGYKEELIKSYFHFKDRSDLNFIHQAKQTGTADAIQLARQHIDGEFLVLSGDTIFLRKDIKKLMNTNNSFLYTKQTERLFEYGTIEFEGEFIKKIWEKSTTPVSEFVNCSAYHFDKRVFNFIPKTAIDRRFGERIITNTINLMLEKGIRFHGVYTDDLFEISYPKDIKIVEEKLKK